MKDIKDAKYADIAGILAGPCGTLRSGDINAKEAIALWNKLVGFYNDDLDAVATGLGVAREYVDRLVVVVYSLTHVNTFFSGGLADQNNHMDNLRQVLFG